MKEEIVQNFLLFTDKYGLNPYLLASIIVLGVIFFKAKRLLEQKKEHGKIKAFEYPPLILGILLFFILLIFAFN